MKDVSAALLVAGLLLFGGLSGLEGSVVVDLTEYTPEEFNLELQNHESIFVKFYTPSCPHCKSMAKDFALVARQLQEHEEEGSAAIVLAEVDCSHDAGEEICSKYAIVGFPTLKLFRYGSFYKNYAGQRNAKTMKKWLLSQIQGSSRILPSVSHLSEVVQQADAVTVSAVLKTGHTKLLAHFLKASKRVKQHPHFSDLLFYHVIVDDVQTVWAAFSMEKAASSVTLRRPHWLRSDLEPESVSITLSLKTNITEWVMNQTHGAVKFRTPKTDRNVHDPRVVGPLVVAFYDFDFRNDTNFTHHWRDQILALVADYPMFTFAISRSSDYAFYLQTKSLAVPRKPDAPVVILYDDLTVPYAMNASFSPQALRAFLHEIMGPTGYLPQLKSDSTCPDNVNWTLVCLPGQEFKRVSLSVKSVVLLVYKQVNEETMKLAMKVGKVHAKVGKEMLDVFAVDAARNQIPHAFEYPDNPVIFYITPHKKIHRIDRKFADYLVTELSRELLKKSSNLKMHRIKSEL